MRVLMTGATGFLGGALADALLDRGAEIGAFTRDPARLARRFGGRVRGFHAWVDAPDGADAVVNLAGEPLIGGRWTAARKERIRASRIGTTDGILRWLAGLAARPEVLLSGSAIGYYGYSEERRFTEDDPSGDDFGARLCADWEASARRAEALGVRVCLLRTGVVLHPAGGALARMLPAFRFGLGGPLASGRQWLSWIHLDDWVGAVLDLLGRRDLAGPFDLTAPQPVRNEEFSRALARALRRPCALRVPAAALRLIAGEGAELLVEGQQVLPQKLLASGFAFAYPAIAEALRDLEGR